MLLFLMRLLFRIEYSGMENIPREGPLLIAANHVTYLDPLWISIPIRRRVRYMAWDKIFRIPVAGSLFRWFGAFPVSLENPELGAYKAALITLQQGEALMIFPEGGRSPDGRLLPFKQGAARLAILSGATILPVVVRGGAKVWNRDMLLPRPAKVSVEYLQPIPREQFEPSAQALARQIRDSIVRSLQELPPVMPA
jgi:1-acyl-sn-glycerol-3-phosphate acyltransferase